MTLEKLATLAGVSLGTVSKAFSGSKEISEKTKQKIFSIAKQTGCYTKYMKVDFDKKIVAVIIPELKSAYYVDIAVYLEDALKNNGFLTVFCSSNFNEKTELDFIEYFNAKKSCDGIIMVNSRCSIPKDVSFPVVVIGSTTASGKNVDRISFDFLSGLDKAIRHLKENGHTKIAFLGENFTKSKEELFKVAMTKNRLHINSDYIIRSSKRFEQAGMDDAERIFSLPTPPTAVIAAYDYIALGAIKYAKEHGKNIPDDLSIIGMDDISMSSHSSIDLSSIKSNVKEVCDIAIDLLLKKIESKFFTLRQHISVECELQIRGTVKDISK